MSEVLFIVSEKGYWAEECIEPLKKVRENHETTVATPTGEKPVPDEASIEGYESFVDEDEQLNSPVPLVEAFEDRERFDAVVFPGGHGTLWDINQDHHGRKILAEFLDEDKPALVICHAVGILGFARNDKGYVVEGKDVTGFPNEWEDGQVDENEIREGEKLPYRVEDEVRSAGGNWDAELDDDISVTVDGKLVTARGPDSSRVGAEKFLEQL